MAIIIFHRQLKINISLLNSTKINRINQWNTFNFVKCASKLYVLVHCFFMLVAYTESLDSVADRFLMLRNYFNFHQKMTHSF